jgi:hypothetical protein
MELLQEHNFELVRQRKHKIYRNPDGITFVLASTPSDRNASDNALATLRRVLRGVPPDAVTSTVRPSRILYEPAITTEPVPEIESVSAKTEPSVGLPGDAMSEQDWEAWKRQYWHDEKLQAKNEKFLSAVSKYVGKVSELMHERKDVAPGPAADAVKNFLRGLQYKSKVLVYNCKCFNQGVIAFEAADQPIVWATNGHIGISAFIFLNAYTQHATQRLASLRFVYDGTPLLFELPEKGARKFIRHAEGRVVLAAEKPSQNKT